MRGRRRPSLKRGGRRSLPYCTPCPAFDKSDLTSCTAALGGRYCVLLLQDRQVRLRKGLAQITQLVSRLQDSSLKAMHEGQVQQSAWEARHGPPPTYTHSHTSQWRKRESSVPAGSQESLGAAASSPGPVSPILVPASLSLACTPGKHAGELRHIRRGPPPGSPLSSILGLRATASQGPRPYHARKCPPNAGGEQLLTYYPGPLSPWPAALQRKQPNGVDPGVVGLGRALGSLSEEGVWIRLGV